MAKKKRMGRPPLPKDRRLGVMLCLNASEALMDRIEVYRLDRLLESRAEAARELIERGLKSAKVK